VSSLLTSVVLKDACDGELVGGKSRAIALRRAKLAHRAPYLGPLLFGLWLASVGLDDGGAAFWRYLAPSGFPVGAGFSP
jgi:hypothetical protein